MTPSLDLFNLIKSLEKNEKRFFRLYSALQGEDKSYMKLFEAILAQEEYDEAKIKRLFKGNKKFLNTFSSWKNYLYSLILKSLRIHYSERSVNAELANMLADAETLYEKGLFGQCRKILSKGKKMALLHEKYPYFFMLAEQEDWVTIHDRDTEKVEGLTATVNEAIASSDKYRDELEYQKLNRALFELYRKKGYVRDVEKNKEYKLIMEHPLLIGEEKPISFRSKLFFYGTHSVYNMIKGDWKQTFKYRLKQIESAESYPDIIKRSPEAYVLLLWNLLSNSTKLKNHDVFKKTLKKMRTIQNPVPSLRHKIFEYSHIDELYYYEKITGQFKEAVKLIPAVKEYLDKYKGKISKENVDAFCICLAYAYFGVGNYHEALVWLNQILNKYDKDYREDIYFSLRIMSVIIHYELGNEIFLEYDIRSSSNFIRKKRQFYMFEFRMIDFFKKKLIKADTLQKRFVAFRQLKKELVAISKDPNMSKVFSVFDFISWVESKIQNRTFSEIVKEKAAGYKNK